MRLSGIAKKLCTNVQIKAFCAPRLRYVSRLRSITESPADDEINTLISSLWSLSSLHFTHNSRAFLHWSDYHSCASRSTGTWPNINGEFVNCRTGFRRRIRLFSNWLSADLGESLHYTSQLFLFFFFYVWMLMVFLPELVSFSKAQLFMNELFRLSMQLWRCTRRSGYWALISLAQPVIPKPYQMHLFLLPSIFNEFLRSRRNSEARGRPMVTVVQLWHRYTWVYIILLYCQPHRWFTTTFHCCEPMRERNKVLHCAMRGCTHHECSMGNSLQVQKDQTGPTATQTWIRN